MIYVSMIEIFVKARASLEAVHGRVTGAWITTGAFFGGLMLIALIDRIVPSYENPHEARSIEEMEEGVSEETRLMRMGTLTAVAIGLHNFPEGLATFLSALSDPTLGLAIMTAVAVHNIPEGISVSVPVSFATGSRNKAFWLSFLSGAAEPVGAVIGYTIVSPFFSKTVFGVLFTSVAGIMIFISLDELLPTAKEYGKGHVAIYGLVCGMAVMALSLLLFL